MLSRESLQERGLDVISKALYISSKALESEIYCMRLGGVTGVPCLSNSFLPALGRGMGLENPMNSSSSWGRERWRATNSLGEK